jgi:NADH-quinone oxidoreductase subunit N
MSTAPKAAAFAVLMRITFSGFPGMHERWSALIWVLAALSMTIGNLGALKQNDVKRMLAYSSIAHAGYLLVAFTAFSQTGIAAACFYTASYAAMNVGAFAVITQVGGYDEELRTVEDYQGLAMRRPILTALLAFFLLSLIGIPFTGGFFGKFYVFTSALQAGHVWLAVIGLINSGVACFYYLRLLSSVYAKPEESNAVTPGAVFTVSVPAGLGLFLAAAATLMLGIFPGHALRLANSAANRLDTDRTSNFTAEWQPATQASPPGSDSK